MWHTLFIKWRAAQLAGNGILFFGGGRGQKSRETSPAFQTIRHGVPDHGANTLRLSLISAIRKIVTIIYEFFNFYQLFEWTE